MCIMQASNDAEARSLRVIAQEKGKAATTEFIIFFLKIFCTENILSDSCCFST